MRPIDADALKKWIMEAPAPPNELPDGYRIIDFVDNAPTVDPNLTAKELIDILKDYRLKNGEWVDPKDGNPDHVTCTCCFKIFNKLDPTWNYCPSCGAKMEGADDE